MSQESSCPTCGRPLDENFDLDKYMAHRDKYVARPSVIPPATLAALENLGAPAEFYDPAYWARIDKLTEGTGVYYLDEFRRYLLWWDCTIPSKRVKDRKRQFLNWIKKALARDDYRSKLAAMEGK